MECKFSDVFYTPWIAIECNHPKSADYTRIGMALAATFAKDSCVWILFLWIFEAIRKFWATSRPSESASSWAASSFAALILLWAVHDRQWAKRSISCPISSNLEMSLKTLSSLATASSYAPWRPALNGQKTLTRGWNVVVLLLTNVNKIAEWILVRFKTFNDVPQRLIMKHSPHKTVFSLLFVEQSYKIMS